MERFAFLLASAQIRLRKKTNIFIYSMSGRIESDMLYKKLAITYIERKKRIILKKDYTV